MTPKHERWEEFRYILACELGLLDSDSSWKCNHTTEKTTEILKHFDVDVDNSLAYLSLQGGVCDCEIIVSFRHMAEVDEIDEEDLISAAQVYDELVNSDHYKKQKGSFIPTLPNKHPFED